MSMTDPIADMLTRIRNAMSVEHPTVAIPSSKLKKLLASLKKKGTLAVLKLLTETAQDLKSYGCSYAMWVKDASGVLSLQV